MWLPLMDKTHFSSIKYIYKAINGLNANLSKEFFEFITSRSRRRTTDNLTLKLPQLKCIFLKNTIFYSGSQYWNDCPYSLRNTDNPKALIVDFKNYFI
jgi:hypothetical protein